MPKEVRYLIFSHEELYQALLADLHSRAQPRPKGHLKGVQVSSDEMRMVTLTYASDKGTSDIVIFQAQEVLRTLIGYCSRRKIPMSAKATKSVEVKGGLVGLMCTLNFDNTNTITASNGKLSYQDEQTDEFKDDAKKAAASAAATAAAIKASNAPPKAP